MEVGGERYAVASAGRRSLTLDSLRGAAILLMILDHVLVVVDGPAWSVGRLLTRPSLPAFALLLGALAVRPLSRRRLLMWCGVVAVVPVLYELAGIPGFALMAWLGLGRFVAVRLPARGRTVALVVGLAVVANNLAGSLMVPGEYSPLAVVGLVLVGRQLGPEVIERAAGRLRLPVALAAVGRRPMAWYVGHLAALALLNGVLLSAGA